MTPCEQKGLKEGQWVWLKTKGAILRSKQWVVLYKDDGSISPCFMGETESPDELSVEGIGLNGIDWRQGFWGRRPTFIPLEYRGENPAESGVKESLTTDDPRNPEFWRDAPEGATHWIPPSPASSDVDKGVFAKKVDGQWMGWAGTRWKAIPDADGRTFGKSVEQVAIPRPEPENPEWDGEGLPPVGTVCEVVSPNTGTSSRIRIVAHGETMLLADIEGQGESPLMKGRNFRPLRPHRERVIDEAMSVSGPYIDSRATAEKMAGALYDAGMLHLSEDKDG